MKVCYINTLYYPTQVGGAEKSVQFLAEAVVKNGGQAVVICLSDKPAIYEHNGVKVYALALVNFYWPFANVNQNALKKLAWHSLDTLNPIMASRVGQILDTEKPDVIHTNNVGGFSVLVWRQAKQRGLKIIHTLRDYYLLCTSTTMFKNGQNCQNQCGSCALFSRPRRQATHLVDHVVGISRFILDKHINAGYFPNAQQSVIFNAYDRPENVPLPEKHSGLRFGYIGRLAPSKGLELLIDSFCQVFEKDDSVELLIGGTGESNYVQLLKKRVNGDNVRFLGKVVPEQFYPQLDFTVVPSLWHEPLGRVVIESNVYGIPVLAAKRGGISEIVFDGVNGWLFDPAIQNGLGELLKNSVAKKNDFKFEVCAASAKVFSSKEIARGYFDVYAGSSKESA